MFNNNQPLVHLTRQTQRSPDHQLPRGECRFILPEVDNDGSRQRCTCVSFSLNNAVPGALCGCSHQAWHHIQEPVGESVSLEEHHALLDKVRRLEEAARKMQEDALKDRRDREKSFRDMQQAYYQNLYHMRYYVDEKMEKLRIHTDDKLESVEDKATEVETLTKRISDIDENVMRLEEKLDNGKRLSRSLTPLLEGQASPLQLPPAPARPAPELPFRTDKHHRDSWDVRVILVPSKSLPFAFGIDSIPWRRCQTRGLHQDLHLRDRTYQTFIQCAEACFMAIFRRRPWMPLQCLRSSDMSLCQLAPDACDPSLWDYDFLESQCMAHDKLQGDVIYIALQQEELSWEDIRSLPCIFGSDESCWEYHEELDAKSKDAIAAEDRMETDIVKPATGTDEFNSPPPYTSRASMYSPDTPRQGPLRPSALDVLATASSMAGPQRGAPSISERSNYSAPSIISERSVSTMGSIDSTLALPEGDEHRTKRRMFLRSPSGLHNGPQGLGPQSAPSSPPQSQIYYSGRVKRKITPKTKVREPMDWRTSEINFKSLLHRNDSKEKRPSTSASSGSQHQHQPLSPHHSQHSQQSLHQSEASAS
jgi:hypothetical protein